MLKVKETLAHVETLLMDIIQNITKVIVKIMSIKWV